MSALNREDIQLDSADHLLLLSALGHYSSALRNVRAEFLASAEASRAEFNRLAAEIEAVRAKVLRSLAYAPLPGEREPVDLGSQINSAALRNLS